MKLSPSSVRDAINELKAYQKGLEEKMELLAERLAELGVELAKSNLEMYGRVDEGDLLNSIGLEKSTEGEKAVFKVVADCDHAIYVEFGTGTVGEAHGYAGDITPSYCVGTHFVTLERPYKGFDVGSYGWFYYKNGQLIFTEGMESKPFMWDTLQDLGNKVAEIALEIFEED